MKRILYWVLILQFATGHNLLAEVLRMPSLLEHFELHQTETPDLSFARFLFLHYLEVSHTHADNSHAQLPLHCAHGPMADSVIDHHFAVEIACCLLTIERTGLPLHDERLIQNDFSFGLFRPPIA